MSDAGGGGSPREQGQEMLRQGRFQEAAAMLRRAVEDSPSDESAWRLLGAALSSSGDRMGAISAFEQTVALAPGSAKNHYNLAVALQGVGNVGDARRHLEQAVTLDPDYSQARVALNALGGAAPAAGAAPPPLPTTPPTPPAMPELRDNVPLGRVGDTGAYTPNATGASPTPPAMPAGGYAPPGQMPSYAPPPPAGAPGAPAYMPPGGAYAPPPVLGMGYGQEENTSGMKGTVPTQVQGGWNWGAFFLGWIWLINHKLIAWGIALLVLNLFSSRRTAILSVIGLGIAIYLGIKGNEIGWRNRRFQSVEDFKACQRIWMWWGIGVTLGLIVLAFIVVLLIGAAATQGITGGQPNPW